ncbi:hypothetical protein U1Q18_049749 [Sarracenia purpurea var. burkii]
MGPQIYRLVNRFHNPVQKRILAKNRRKRVAARVLFDVTPYKEMERDVEQFSVRIRVAMVGGGVRNHGAGLAAKLRAPGGVVLEELTAKMVDVGGTASVVAPLGRAGRSARLSPLLWSASTDLGWGFPGLDGIGLGLLTVKGLDRGSADLVGPIVLPCSEHLNLLIESSSRVLLVGVDLADLE